MADRKLALLFQFKGVDGLSPMMKGIAGLAGGAQQKLRALTGTLKDEKKELDALNHSISAAGVPTREMVADQKRLEAAVAATTTKIDRQKAAISRTAKADARGEGARSSGMKKIAMGVGIAAPLVLAAKAGVDFQSGMSDIRIKAGETAEQSKALKLNIIEAAEATKQLPISLQQGVDVLVGAGMDAGKAVDIIRPIGKAATSNFGQIEDLSRTAYANSSNLNVPVGKITDALDAMAAAGNAGQFELKDMALYFPALTAQAQALKQTGVPAVADLSAALQVAFRGTGTAEGASAAIGDLMAKMNSTDVLTKFSKGFGVDLPKAMAKAEAAGKTPLEAIAEITNKTLGGDLKKLPLLFGDREAQNGVRSLIQNMDDYRTIRDEAMKAQGTIEAAYGIKSKEAAANIVALQGSIANLSLIVADKLLPAMTPLIDKTTSAITAVSAWTDKHPKLTEVLITGAAAVAGLNLAVGAGQVIYGSIVGPLTAAQNAFILLKESQAVAAVVSGASSLIAGGWAIVTAASAPYVTAAVSAAAATWAVAWPVLAVVAAIALVTAAIVGVVWAFTHWDQVTAYFEGVWTRIKQVFVSIDWLQLGKNMLMGLANGLIGGIPTLILAIGRVAMSGVDHFKKILGIHSPSRVFMGFGDNIGAGLEVGLRRSTKGPMGEARKMAVGIAGAMALSAPVAIAQAPALTAPALSAIQPSRTQAGPSGSAAARAPIVVQFGDITIHIHTTADQSPQDIAEAVAEAIDKLKRDGEKRGRDAFRDDEA
jgi:TP901 family phage tail tape measure protein